MKTSTKEGAEESLAVSSEDKNQESKSEKKLHRKTLSQELKQSNSFKTVIISVLLSSLAGMLFGFLAGNVKLSQLRKWEDKALHFKDHKLSQQDARHQTEDKKNQNQQNSQLDLATEDAMVVKAVENASPAVVSIVVTKDVPKLDNFFNPFFNDPFFNPFGFRQKREPQQPEMEKREIGGGTGFIVSADGYILTNRHVVDEEGAEYTIITNKGDKYDAKVLARDKFMDVAVLKIKAKNLPTVKFGDSDRLKIGQTVIAIGNSLGEFRNTVSKGIISGLKRNVSAGDGMGRSELLEEVIQTDAAINPGNSGGPLLNIKGEVIGINVAMAMGAENIGFAIPINQAKKIYESIKENGKIAYPYLGVRYLVINKQIAKENHLPFDYGALVVRGEKLTDLAVIPGSPADKAGIVENDIILEIDGEKITKENDLARAIRKRKVGDTIILKIWNKGKEKTVKAVLEEAGD